MHHFSTNTPESKKIVTIPVTGKPAKPRRVKCCELCGSVDQVKRTADPDRGGLLLCADCRRLFGFEGGQDGNN